MQPVKVEDDNELQKIAGSRDRMEPELLRGPGCVERHWTVQAAQTTVTPSRHQKCREVKLQTHFGSDKLTENNSEGAGTRTNRSFYVAIFEQSLIHKKGLKFG